MWSDARALVTGSEGFLGKTLVERLEELGAEVRRFDLVFGESVVEPRDVSEAVFAFKPTHIFHLAGNSIVSNSEGSPWQSVQVNAMGTLNVLEGARAYMENHALQAVVCSSSNHIYGKQERFPYDERATFNHTGAYSIGKIAADYFVQLYAKQYGVPAVALRHTNTYGPEDIHDSHIVRGTVLALMAGQRPIIRSDGTVRKGYLYIDDTVEAYLTAALAPEKGISALNASSDESINALEIVKTISEVMDSELTPIIQGRENDEENEYLDSSLIKMLGWSPKWNLRAGIVRTIDGMKVTVPA